MWFKSLKLWREKKKERERRIKNWFNNNLSSIWNQSFTDGLMIHSTSPTKLTFINFHQNNSEPIPPPKMQRIEKIKRSKNVWSIEPRIRWRKSFLQNRSSSIFISNRSIRGKKRTAQWTRETEQESKHGTMLIHRHRVVPFVSPLLRGAVFRAANDALPVESLWAREPVALLK